MSEGEVGIPEAEPAQEVVEEATPPSANYHERIRSEADFAVEEVQKKDRYINELHQKANKLNGLEQYVDAVGGVDNFVKLASLGNSIETNPSLKQTLQDIQNGTYQAPAQEPEEEIFDPEVKLVDSKVSELEAANRSLTERLNRSEAVTLRSSLTENIEKALTKFSSEPELMEKASTEITRAVESLEQNAANGDREAAHRLAQLGNPDGSQTLRMMTLPIYDEFVEKKLGEAADQPNGEAMRSKATDDPSTVRAAMPVSKIAVPPGTKVDSRMVADIMAKVSAKLGKDPDKLFPN